MKVGIEVKPHELVVGNIVGIDYVHWYFDNTLHVGWGSLGLLSSHHNFGKYLFHHTLKGFELIDDNYTR